MAVASFFSWVALFLLAWWRDKLHLLKTCSRRQWAVALILGLLNLCLYYYVLFQAYDRLPAQEALTLNYSWPVMLAILSVFLLGQRPRLLELLAVALAYAGVIVIVTQSVIFSLNFADPLGVALALGSTVLWALFWIVNIKQRQDAIITLFLSFLLAVPILAVATWWFTPIKAFSYAALASAAYVGVLEMGVTGENQRPCHIANTF